MILLFCFSICCFMIAVFATGFLFLQTLASANSLKPGLLKTVIDCCEGRLWVKGRMVLERCLTRFEKGSKYSGRLTRWIRNEFERASRKYETFGTDGDLSSEDFKNRGTFIVVRSSVFAVSSAQKTHFARDAHSAFFRWASGCQGQFDQWMNRLRGQVSRCFCFHASRRDIFEKRLYERSQSGSAVLVFLFADFFDLFCIGGYVATDF